MHSLTDSLGNAHVKLGPGHAMYLAPLLFTGGIPKMIRAAVSPDVLTYLLPGNLWHLVGSSRSTDRRITIMSLIVCFQTGIHGIAEQRYLYVHEH
jgi:hypothetical protein